MDVKRPIALNGTPGARLTIQVAGRPAKIFADAEFVQELSQPLVADQEGRYPSFYVWPEWIGRVSATETSRL